MANMNTHETGQPWEYPVLLNSNSHTVVFNTKNTFVDENIKAIISVKSGSVTPNFDVINSRLNTYFNEGTSENNSIIITPQATSSAGFIDEYDSSHKITGTSSYWKIKDGVAAADSADVNIVNTGTNNIASVISTKTTTEPASGYYIAFKGEGNSQISSAGWMQTGSLTNSISGTKYFPIQTATVTHSGGELTITNNYSATPDIYTSLTSQTTNGATLSNSQPSTGYYIVITNTTEALSGKTKATKSNYTETFSAGYLPEKSSETISSATFVEPTVTIQSNSVTNYLTIPAASFTNAAISGQTYTDISSSSEAPILISGDYLYINEGYTNNKKISLAKLIPNNASNNLAASYLLNGYSAYDNNGNLITGNILNYNGSYEVV